MAKRLQDTLKYKADNMAIAITRELGLFAKYKGANETHIFFEGFNIDDSKTVYIKADKPREGQTFTDFAVWTRTSKKGQWVLEDKWVSNI